jgi:hypothetical protein
MNPKEETKKTQKNIKYVTQHKKIILTFAPESPMREVSENLSTVLIIK